MGADVKAYLASPFGFSEAGRHFYKERFVPMVESVGFEILDPWQLTPQNILDAAIQLPFGPQQKEKWAETSRIIGKNNQIAIERCDILIAVLDGIDVDSGTASEIGFAAGIGKPIEAYRGDFRMSADNIGSMVNIQVEYFIRKGGGVIVSTVKDLERTLRLRYERLRSKK